MDSDDGDTHLAVEGQSAAELPDASIFPSPDAASEFFKRGSLGYSPASKSGTFDGIELRSDLACRAAENRQGGIELLREPGHFSVRIGGVRLPLLMRDIANDWLARESVCSECDEARRGSCMNPNLLLSSEGPARKHGFGA